MDWQIAAVRFRALHLALDVFQVDPHRVARAAADDRPQKEPLNPVSPSLRDRVIDTSARPSASACGRRRR